MASQQISFKALDQSQVSVAKLNSIDPQLELDPGMTVNSLMALIEETRAAINAYNDSVSEMESTYRAIRQKERTIAQLTAQMKFGVAYKYGAASNEYQLIKADKPTRRRHTAVEVPQN
jgi:hypothetical protein